MGPGSRAEAGREARRLSTSSQEGKMVAWTPWRHEGTENSQILHIFGIRIHKIC